MIRFDMQVWISAIIENDEKTIKEIQEKYLPFTREEVDKSNELYAIAVGLDPEEFKAGFFGFLKSLRPN